MKKAMLYLPMDSAVWYETMGGEKLLCGVPQNELLGLLKKKSSQANLLKGKPSN